MSQSCAEIVQILDRADDLFKQIGVREEKALKLWDEGIQRLAAAIWICEREADKSEIGTE